MENDNYAMGEAQPPKTVPVTVIIGEGDEQMVTHIPQVEVPVWEEQYEKPSYFFDTPMLTPRKPTIQTLSLHLHNPVAKDNGHVYISTRKTHDGLQDTANALWLAMGIDEDVRDLAEKLAVSLDKLGFKIVKED